MASVQQDLSIPDEIGTRSELAAALTAIRERAGVSIRELAKRIDARSGTLGDYFGGRHLPSTTQLPVLGRALRECGLSQAEVDAWLDAMRRVKARPSPAGRSTPPWPGLLSFQPEDSERFFGRAEETAQILDAITRLHHDPGPSHAMLAVIGPSGSGKSSLLRAGVVATLRLRAGTSGTCALMTPGRTPLDSLAQATAELGDGPRVLVVDQFEEIFTSVDDPTEAVRFVRALTGLSPATVVVIGMRADFYAPATREPALLAALQHAQIVVGPMAGDELRSVITGPAEAAGVTVEDGLVERVLADIAPSGTTVGGTVGAHDAGALPLLSHALLATWEGGDGRRLTLADYRAVGGIDAAVQSTAEDVYLELDDDERAIARRLFLRLVHIDDEVAVTRRRVSRDELSSLEAGTGSPVDEIVNRFVVRRLLTASASTVEVSHEALLSVWPRLRDWVEADRDGLRLHRQVTDGANTWLDSDRDPALLLRGGRLVAATDWVAGADRDGDLNQLERDYLAASTEAATAARTRARRRTRRLRQLLAAVAVLAIVAAGLAAYSLHARSAAVSSSRAASDARDNALSRQVAFQARELEAHDPALAEQLALVAYRIAPTTVAEASIIDDSAKPPITRVLGAQGPTPLGVSNDGAIIAVGHATDGSVHLYRRHAGATPTALGTIPGPAPVSTPYAITFTPDGSTAAIGGSDGSVRLWRVSDPRRPTAIATLTPAFTGAVESIALSPDGRTLAASSNGSTPVREWDVSNPAAPAALPSPAGLPAGSTVQSLVFNPAGTELVAGGGDQASSFVAQWRAPRPGSNLPKIVRGDSPSITNSVAFSPDGSTIFAGASGGTLRVLDDTTLAVTASVTADNKAKINSVAVSPDGTRVAAGTGDDVVYEWSTNGLQQLSRTNNPGPVTGLRYVGSSSPSLLSTAADGALRIVAVKAQLPHVGTVFNMNFSADGSRLAVITGGVNANGVQLWDTHDPAHPVAFGPLTAQLSNDGGNSGTGAISPNGLLLAAGTRTGKLGLFDVSNPAAPTFTTPVLQVLDAASLVESAAFSPDGTLLAVSGDDGTIRILDIHNPAQLRTVATLRTHGLMLDVTFSPNGRLIAGANSDNHAYIWDVSDLAHPVQDAKLTFANYVYGVAFSPDGRRFAAGSSDHTARVWDITRPAHPVPYGDPLLGATDYVFAVAFSPDGKTLATGSNDGTVRQYSVEHGANSLPSSSLTASGGSVFVVIYRPNVAELIAAGRGTAVTQWSTKSDAYAGSLCPLVGDPITRDEWALYVPGAKYNPPCR